MLGEDLDKLWPLIYDGQSDSASFDNALELLVMGGYPLAHAMMMMIPEAWAGNPLMDEDRRAFYEYHAALMEPWDGPAAMAFTDGRQIGATLDRNGLRPARYIVTDDDYIVMASEVGVLDIPGAQDRQEVAPAAGQDAAGRPRAGPHHRRRGAEAHARHGEAVSRVDRALAGSRSTSCRSPAPPLPTDVPLLDRQQAFGYTQEDLKFILAPMARNGEEAIGSMGNDAALPVLSRRPKVLYNYFKQLFAQVTNPPIDPIREELVMSLVSFIGPRPNLLAVDDRRTPRPADAPRSAAADPHQRARWRRSGTSSSSPAARSSRSSSTSAIRPRGARTAWRPRSRRSAAHAEDAIHLGYNILILSDRKVSARAAADSRAARHRGRAPAPGAARACARSTGLVVETGSAREVHHFALLAGYGAEAIHPYLALETLAALAEPIPRDRPQELAKRFIKAICKGLYKVMSKMGISTYQSYCGAQIFEAVGLQKRVRRQVLHRHGEQRRRHRPVRGRRGGACGMHALAFGDDPLLRDALDAGGEYQYRIRGEEHMWTPDSIAKLQHAARTGQLRDVQGIRGADQRPDEAAC